MVWVKNPELCSKLRWILVLGVVLLVLPIAYSLTTNVNLTQEDDQDILIIETDTPAKCYIENGEIKTLSAVDSENKVFEYQVEPVNQVINGWCDGLENQEDFKAFEINISFEDNSTEENKEEEDAQGNIPFLITHVSPSDLDSIALSDYINVRTTKKSICNIKTEEGTFTMQNLNDTNHRIQVMEISQKKGKTSFIVECYNEYDGKETKRITYYLGVDKPENNEENQDDNKERSTLSFPQAMEFINKNLPLIIVLTFSIGLNLTAIIILISLLKKRKNSEEQTSNIQPDLNLRFPFPSEGSQNRDKHRLTTASKSRRPMTPNNMKPRINLEPFTEFEKSAVKPKEERDKGEFKHLDLDKYIEKKEEWLDISDILEEKKKDKKESTENKKNDDDPIERLEKQIYIESLKGKTNLQLIAEALKENYKDNPNQRMVTWAIDKLIKQKQINVKQAGSLINQLKADKIIDDMQALQMLGELNLI